MSIRRLASLFAASVVTCCVTLPSFADSQARIVRLSQVDGDVQIDRNTGQGYEKAFLNLPVTQGTKLRTGADARAEIEFEDGTTLRIAPGTAVEFPELARRDSGAWLSQLQLQSGKAYLNFKGDKSKGDRDEKAEFTLGFGQDRLVLVKPVHLRVEMNEARATVSVFKGEVEADGSSGKVSVGKMHSATFDLAGRSPYTVANSLEPDPYDEWDKEQDKYHQQYSALAGSSALLYGASDLDYYGSFYNIPGYGMMWQPYMVGAGWDPYMNGAWAWYPGAGYTWVSAYPWGWTPYRYGSWTYLSSYGWFWRPGSTWAGWNTGPQIANAPATFSAPRPPATPGQTLAVNRGSTVSSTRIIQNRSEIRVGAAGLGVARGSVRNLGKVSQQMERTGLSRGGVQAPPSAGAMRMPPASSRVASGGGGSARSARPSSGAGSQMGGGGSRSSGGASRSVPHR